MRNLDFVISCLLLIYVRAQSYSDGRKPIIPPGGINKEGDDDSTIDYDCPWAFFDGTCDNFHPTQDCLFSLPEYIKDEKCEIRAIGSCIPQGIEDGSLGGIGGNCKQNCVDFHMECCCPAETQAPTTNPTMYPTTAYPTSRPTPTRNPTHAPTDSPTFGPTDAPTTSPTKTTAPSRALTNSPTREPWNRPTRNPTDMPAVPTPMPTPECYDPSTGLAYYFSMIGKTETCVDFFANIGVAQNTVCLFDAKFSRSDRCLGLPPLRCKKIMAENEFNYEDDQCLQECITFHTLCCCGLSS